MRNDCIVVEKWMQNRNRGCFTEGFVTWEMLTQRLVYKLKTLLIWLMFPRNSVDLKFHENLALLHEKHANLYLYEEPCCRKVNMFEIGRALGMEDWKSIRSWSRRTSRTTPTACKTTKNKAEKMFKMTQHRTRRTECSRRCSIRKSCDVYAAEWRLPRCRLCDSTTFAYFHRLLTRVEHLLSMRHDANRRSKSRPPSWSITESNFAAAES